MRISEVLYVFGPLDEESNIRSLADLYGFSRLTVARFEVIVQRARGRAGVDMQPSQAAWMLMRALRIPVEQCVHILSPFRGQLPATEQQYHEFVAYIKRYNFDIEPEILAPNNQAKIQISRLF